MRGWLMQPDFFIYSSAGDFIFRAVPEPVRNLEVTPPYPIPVRMMEQANEKAVLENRCMVTTAAPGQGTSDNHGAGCHCGFQPIC